MKTREKKLHSIRLAAEGDLEGIYSLDVTVQINEHWREFISHVVLAKTCFVIKDKQILGCGVFDYTFYENGFITLLIAHPKYRRRGIGTELIKYFESVCQTTKLFTSTNLSNHPMQSLLAKLGYKLSGVINDLDEGDPELIYVKYLQTKDPRDQSSAY